MAALRHMIGLCLVLGALAIATLALAALFGFAIAPFDLINHTQIVLFPATIVALVLVAILLSGQMRSLAMIYVFMGLAASANVMLPDVIAALRSRPSLPDSGSITLMTHNVFGMNYRMAQVQAAIEAEDPDIIVLQEYFGEQATDLHPLLLAKYPYFARCRGGKRANLGLYSRIPFVQTEDGACPNNAYGSDRTGHILVQFQTAGDKRFSVITTHLDWPVPVSRQSEQLADLSEVLDGIDGPLILAGDFNSTPWSYALRGFVARNNLQRETQALPTFPKRFYYFGAWRNAIPLLPLDHVMTRGGIVVHDLHTGQPTASDHLPVVVRFSVP